MDDKYIFKILLLGPSGTGAKTSLMDRIVGNTFDPTKLCTIGVDFKIYGIKTKYGIVKLQIWDLAGQERFRSLFYSHYKGCHCFILGYDITDKDSFKDIKNTFYNLIFNNLGSNPIKNPLIYLVANKIDLQDRIQVPDEEAISFANEKQIPYFKVSAKTGEGVDNLINHIVNSLIKKFPNSIINQNKAITFDEKKKKKVSNISLKTLNKEDKQHFLFLDKYYNY